MVPVILICSVLSLLGLVAIIRDLYEKMNCIETTGEVTGVKEVYDTESPHDVTAYVPIITFEVNGVQYSGKSRRSTLWAKPDKMKTVTILYNPKNSHYFSLKPSTRASGYIFFTIGVIGLVCAWLTFQSGDETL